MHFLIHYTEVFSDTQVLGSALMNEALLLRVQLLNIVCESVTVPS